MPTKTVRWYVLFFFQAEDGIRDLTVTGVQTCALPISVSAGILVVGGASCGVNQSVHLAMKHPEIKALVLLSEITDIDGRNFLRAHPSLQIGRASCRERV